MRMPSYRNPAVYRTVTSSAFLAAALMLAYVESLLPSVIPLPGFKLGLPNLAVMASFFISPAHAAAVSVGRIVLSALLFGNPVSLAMSASGGILSFAVLFSISRSRRCAFSWIGVSVMSAAAHNAGQLAAAAIITGSAAVISYAVPLAAAAVICGLLTGVIMNRAAPMLTRSLGRVFPTHDKSRETHLRRNP